MKKRSYAQIFQSVLLFLLCTLSTIAFAQPVKIKGGGTWVKKPQGSTFITVDIENATGKNATDVYIIMINNKMEDMNIIGKNDVNDDNDNGRIDSGEKDAKFPSPTANGRTILKDDEMIKPGETVRVSIGLSSDPGPEGTVFKILLSENVGGRHHDISPAIPLGEPQQSTHSKYASGSDRVAQKIQNTTPHQIISAAIQSALLPVDTDSVVFEAPYEQSSLVQAGTGDYQLFFSPPLAPYDYVNIGMKLTEFPSEDTTELSLQALEIIPFECLMDIPLWEIGPCDALGGFSLLVQLQYNPQLRGCKKYTFTNSTGKDVSGLQVTFAGTGGSLHATPVNYPEDCPGPAISSNGQITNTMVLNWGSQCFKPGQNITLKVCSENYLFFQEGYWSADGTNLGWLTAGDITETEPGGKEGMGMHFYLNDHPIALLPTNGMGSDFFVIEEVPGDGLAGQQLEVFWENGTGCSYMLPDPVDAPVCSPFLEIDCGTISQLDPETIELGDYNRTGWDLFRPFRITGWPNPIADLQIIPPEMLLPGDEYQCGVDYKALGKEASPPYSEVGLQFFREGPYFVQTTDTTGFVSQQILEVATVNYDEGLPGAVCQSRPARQVDCAPADLAIVSTRVDENVWGTAGRRCNRIPAAVELICEVWAANDSQVIRVVIDAHGAPGRVEIGNEELDIDNLNSFVQGVQGKISELTIYGCGSAWGMAGSRFFNALADSLNIRVTGFTGDVNSAERASGERIWYTFGREEVFDYTVHTTMLDLHWRIHRLYPQPNSGKLILEVTASREEKLQLWWLNAQGQQLRVEKRTVVSGQNTLSLDISDFPPGVYWLRIQGAEGAITKKVIKL